MFYKTTEDFLRDNRKRLGALKIKCGGGCLSKLFIEFIDHKKTYQVEGNHIRELNPPALIPGTEEGK